MKKNIWNVYYIILFSLLIGGCSSVNLEETKSEACNTWKQAGYTCVGYEGYQWGLWFGGNYGGAKVWNTLERKNTSVIYSGYVQRWGDEYHIYGPIAIDALRGN